VRSDDPAALPVFADKLSTDAEDFAVVREVRGVVFAGIVTSHDRAA